MAQWIRIHLPIQGTRVDLWFGKPPHAVEQLSPHSTATEAWAPRSLCSKTREVTAMRNPHTATE